MDVYALVGRSGTGKSYKAQVVAGMYDIEYILDDGILIKGAKVLAGYSAKREGTRIAAIKRAVFIDDNQKNDVLKALEVNKPDKLLIIGTSEHMIERIMDVLALGDEYTIVRIEEISEPGEIEKASISRRTKGKHVIPVPTFEVKKDFSGYFIDSIKQIVKKSEKPVEAFEKTVVRPTFSYLGRYDIKDGVIKSMASFCAKGVKSVYKINSVDISELSGGIKLTLYVSLKAGEPLYTVANRISSEVKNSVEYMTGKNVLEVNVVIRSIKIEQE